MDPKQAGAGGTLGDIGTHAEHLATFVTGLEIESLSSRAHKRLSTGRVLDDDTIRSVCGTKAEPREPTSRAQVLHR